MFIAHECLGIAVGLLFKFHQPEFAAATSWEKRLARKGVLAACIIGSGLPDLPRVLQMGINGIQGVGLEDIMPPATMLISDILHNYFFWLSFFLGLCVASSLLKLSSLKSWWVYCGKCFAFGMVACHISFDVISHGVGQVFHGTNYFWPLPMSWSVRLSLFDYRLPHHKLALKPEEYWFCYACLLAAILIWRITQPKKSAVAASTMAAAA